MRKRSLGWVLVYLVLSGLIVWVYSLVIAQDGPSSQAAALEVVIDRVDPPNTAGLRADVVINAPVSMTGCPHEVDARAVISGTPAFWKRNARTLAGTHRVGIGLRTSYDYDSARLAPWSGYQLPRDLLNITGPRVKNPSPGKGIKVRRVFGSIAPSYAATIRDWGKTWTPLVLEFRAQLMSRRGFGSCYLALPGLIRLDLGTLDDATVAAGGTGLAAGGTSKRRGAVTFGRVIVHTNGRLLDSESRPRPQFTAGLPWVSELGEIGEDAAVWTCAAGKVRAEWPDIGTTHRDEVALARNETENQTCDGLAVIEARSSGTVRDLTLLVIGGVFALVFGQLLKQVVALITWPFRRAALKKLPPPNPRERQQ